MAKYNEIIAEWKKSAKLLKMVPLSVAYDIIIIATMIHL